MEKVWKDVWSSIVQNVAKVSEFIGFVYLHCIEI